MTSAETSVQAEVHGSIEPGRDYFILVCPPARQDEYRQVLGDWAAKVEMVPNLDSLLTGCVNRPPLAVLLDMTLVMQVGTRVLAPVFELRMNWPVIRCSLLPGGILNGLCMEPRAHGSLIPMLEGILAGDEVWMRELRPPRARRRHLRVEMQCRVRWRIAGSETWLRGTTLDLGAGGAFIVTFEEPEKGTPLEIEVSDVTPEPVCLNASVVGVRRWDDSRLLPGVGVEFDESAVPAEFKKTLAESITLENLV